MSGQKQEQGKQSENARKLRRLLDNLNGNLNKVNYTLSQLKNDSVEIGEIVNSSCVDLEFTAVAIAHGIDSPDALKATLRLVDLGGLLDVLEEFNATDPAYLERLLRWGKAEEVKTEAKTG